MLPTYRINIEDENDAVEFISIVDKPAIERDFVAFNKQKRVAFNEELRIITTPVLIPDKPVYRNDANGEYYLVALHDDVERIYSKFAKDGNFNKINLMHTKGTEQTSEQVYLYEMFLSDERRGISAPEAFKDLPNKTWFASYKVLDDEIWNNIKEGKFNGVSIEGNLGIIDLQKDEDYKEMLEAYNELEKLLEKI